MPQIPIIMPQLGEAIAEATVIALHISEGDQVAVDQDVIEVETNKATMNVSSPCPGKVDRLLVKLNESYPVGAVLGYLEATDGGRAPAGAGSTRRRAGRGPRTRARAARRKTTTMGAGEGCNRTVRGLPVPAHAAGASYMSPRMKARMAELGLHAADLAGVAGSGAAGRVTIQDFEKFLEQLEKNKTDRGLQHARGGRRRHAAELDAAAGHGGAAVQPGGDDWPIAKAAPSKPARPFTCCGRWPWHWPKTARRRAG